MTPLYWNAPEATGYTTANQIVRYRGNPTRVGQAFPHFAITTRGTPETMLSPQLVMYEEELIQIQTIADKLQRDARAQTILVVDKNGQLIASNGVNEELDTVSLSSLVAGNVAATGGIASLIEEEEFTGQFHEGKDLSVHMTIVSRKIILVVLFDKSTTHGLVRLRVKKAEEALSHVFEALAQKSKTRQNDVFAEITDADIDNLFND